MDTPDLVKVETRDQRRERIRREKAEMVAYKLEQEIAMWDPTSMSEVSVCAQVLSSTFDLGCPQFTTAFVFTDICASRHPTKGPSFCANINPQTLDGSGHYFA